MSSQELLSLKEEKEFYVQKLLNLKLKQTIINFQFNKQISLKKNDLLINEEEKKNLENNLLIIKEKLNNLKEKEKNFEKDFSLLNSQINDLKKQKENLINEIKNINEYLSNIYKTDNIIQHILTFDKEFQKKIYNLCMDKVKNVLYNQNNFNNNNNSNFYNNYYQNNNFRQPVMMYQFYPTGIPSNNFQKTFPQQNINQNNQ